MCSAKKRRAPPATRPMWMPTWKARPTRVLRNWDEIKAAEKGSHGTRPSASRLDAVQRALPALAEAAKLGSKAAKARFDWTHWRDLLPKVAEETAELEAEASSDDPSRKAAIEAELGDLLFTVVNLGAISAWTRRWRCADAIFASGSGSAKWNWRPPSRLKSSRRRNSKNCGQRRSGSSRADRWRIGARGAVMILIRECHGHDELEACVRLQVETWGYDQSDVIPAQSVPGDAEDRRADHRRVRYQPARRRRPQGDAKSLVGFAMSLPGVKPGEKNGDGAAALSPFAHAGGERSLPQSRAWRATQAGATT